MRDWRTSSWAVVATAIVVVMAAVAKFTPYPRHAYGLSIFADSAAFLLLCFLCLVLLRNAVSSHGKTRQFWGAMWFASLFWLIAEAVWIWFQIVLKQGLPYPFVGFAFMFLHVLAMTGAIAMGAHRANSHRRFNIEDLDVAILLFWWLYVYAFFALPWQHVVPDAAKAGTTFLRLYSVASISLALGAFVLLFRSREQWRKIYLRLFTATSCYAIASQLTASAIARGRYYSGSLYDIPQIVSICLFVSMGLEFGTAKEQVTRTSFVRRESGMVSWLAMFSVLSLPIIAGWGAFLSRVPYQVFVFRMELTGCALIVLPSCVFLKQYLLGRELVLLLGASQRNVGNLKKLQAQLVQSEKLASMGEMVAGAAHQISNPLTAVIGYSELLAEGFQGDEEHAAWVRKIGQQARRTQDLIKQLLTFAKQDPPQKQLTDLNRVVADAIELSELDLDNRSIRIVQHLSRKLPHLWADSNQLLQVCFHIIGNAIEAMKPKGGGVLTIKTRLEGGSAIVEFSDTGVGIAQPLRIFDPFYTTKPVGQGTGLGLSASYGIVSEHGGTIVCHNRPDGGATFVVSFPIDHTPVATAAVGSALR